MLLALFRFVDARFLVYPQISQMKRMGGQSGVIAVPGAPTPPVLRVFELSRKADGARRETNSPPAQSPTA
ncbi:hypothetical protein C27AD_06575 [Salinisphaera hydrothermalis C27AD]